MNHDYSGALVEHDGFTVTVSLPSAPISVTLASPDLPADVDLPFTYQGGSVAVVVPSLVAYDVLKLSY